MAIEVIAHPPPPAWKRGTAYRFSRFCCTSWVMWPSFDLWLMWFWSPLVWDHSERRRLCFPTFRKRVCFTSQRPRRSLSPTYTCTPPTQFLFSPNHSLSPALWFHGQGGEVVWPRPLRYPQPSAVSREWETLGMGPMITASGEHTCAHTCPYIHMHMYAYTNTPHTNILEKKDDYSCIAFVMVKMFCIFMVTD